jgi:diguanylate cyclase (GGDEF)-like protein
MRYDGATTSRETMLEHICSFADSPYSLADLQLFDGVPDAPLRRLLAQCPVVKLAKGQRIDDSHRARLYIVLSGALSVAFDTRSGMADGTLSRVLKGESVGEQAVLDEAANLAAITALDDAVLLQIEANLVWRMIDQSNGVARNLLRLLSFRIRAANAQLRRRHKLGEFYRQLSMVDGLTGLQNRAWLNDVLPAMVAAASGPLSLVMIDLDHFKKFNDTHGHLGGDQALRTAAGVLSNALRPSDFAVRYGGEEMMVILPDTTEAVALVVAERLCQRLQQATVFADLRVPMPHITASFGVACLATGEDEQALIARADAALYRAKEGGRNRVSL